MRSRRSGHSRQYSIDEYHDLAWYNPRHRYLVLCAIWIEQKPSVEAIELTVAVRTRLWVAPVWLIPDYGASRCGSELEFRQRVSASVTRKSLPGSTRIAALTDGP